MKNHLLKCLDYLSLLNYTGINAKIASKKIEALIYSINFL